MSTPSARHHGSPRNPFELVFLAFLAVAGAPVAFGQVPTPGSLQALLDPTFQRVWSILLVGGCVAALVGCSWPRRSARPGRVSTTGLVIEQIGLVAAGGGAGVYGGALVYLMARTGDLSGIIASGLSLALLVACIIRYAQLQGQLNDEGVRQDGLEDQGD